jgi:recombination DNA repair RAD52 pathway protein
MQTIIILTISITFKTFSHREDIGYQSLDLCSITEELFDNARRLEVAFYIPTFYVSNIPLEFS